MTIELKHLSYSSISLYQMCPKAWFYRYVAKEKAPANANLVLGSAFHGSIEEQVRANCRGEQVQPATIWQEQWSKAIDQEVDWQAELPEKVYNDGLRMLLHPDTQRTINSLRPLIDIGGPAIERYVELRVPGVPVPVIGYIDLIAEDGVPCDFKTSSKSWSQAQAEKEMQPLFYLAAMNQNGWTKNLSYRFRHFVFVKTKTPQCQMFESQRVVNQLLWLAGTIADVWRGIQSENFPCNPNTWKCSPKWCSYWNTCRGVE